MFHSSPVADTDLRTGIEISPPRPERNPSPREQHAHMLAVAAARRLRAAERQGLQRHEDAEYWKAVAPSAVNKAISLREHPSFLRLPE